MSTAAQPDKSRLIVITGATGKQGGAVLAKLQSEGYTNLAAVVRSESLESEKTKAVAASGVEIREGSLDDKASLVKALTGAAGAYLVTPEGEKELEQGTSFVEACVEESVSHVVFSSVAGADQETGVPNLESKRAIEAVLVASGLNHSIVRPEFFFQTFREEYFRPKAGVLYVPMKVDTKLLSVSTDDIAELVEKAFAKGADAYGKAYAAVGDRVSLTEIAAAIGVAAGGTVVAQEIPKEPFGPVLAAMFELLEATQPTSDYKEVTENLGRAPTKFAEYALTAQWPEGTTAESAAAAAAAEATPEATA